MELSSIGDFASDAWKLISSKESREKTMGFFKNIWNGAKKGFNWAKDSGTLGMLGSAASSAIQAGGLGLATLWTTKEGQKFAKEAQKRQYQYQTKLQKQQQQYEAQMSSTAHQREVSDLQAAGLNPILSANNGASTPSTGMGQIGMDDSAQQFQQSISNALQAKQIMQQQQQIMANVKQQEAQSNLANEQAETEQNKREQLDSQTQLNKAEEILKSKYVPEQIKAEVAKTVAETNVVKFNADSNRIIANANLINANSNMKRALIEATEAPSAIAKNDAEAKLNRYRFNKAVQGKLKNENYGETWTMNFNGASHSFNRSYERY